MIDGLLWEEVKRTEVQGSVVVCVVVGSYRASCLMHSWFYWRVTDWV